MKPTLELWIFLLLHLHWYMLFLIVRSVAEIKTFCHQLKTDLCNLAHHSSLCLDSPVYKGNIAYGF